MKRFPLVLAALAAFTLGACSAVPNNRINYVPPSTAPVRQSVEEARGHADHQSVSLAAAAAKAKTATERIKVIEKAVADNPPVLTLAQELHGDLDDLTKLLLDTEMWNSALKSALTNASTQITQLQDQVNIQTSALNDSNNRLNQALRQGVIDKRNAHQFKAFIIGLAMLASVAVMFGIFRGLAFAPPLLYATIGAPAAIGTFLFFWLGSG